MNAGDHFFKLSIPRRGIDWMTLNNEGHHMQTYKRSQAWKQATMVALGVHGYRGPGPKAFFPPVRIETTFMFHSAIRRDPDNFVPTRKPIIDYLAGPNHGGVMWWQDDDPRYISLEQPKIVIVGSAKSGAIDGVVLDVFIR